MTTAKSKPGSVPLSFPSCFAGQVRGRGRWIGHPEHPAQVQGPRSDSKGEERLMDHPMCCSDHDEQFFSVVAVGYFRA